jgi:hypothetical protein
VKLLKKYKVVFSLSYEIEAKSAEKAEAEASSLLIDDVYNAVKYNEITQTFSASTTSSDD